MRKIYHYNIIKMLYKHFFAHFFFWNVKSKARHHKSNQPPKHITADQNRTNFDRSHFIHPRVFPELNHPKQMSNNRKWRQIARTTTPEAPLLRSFRLGALPGPYLGTWRLYVSADRVHCGPCACVGGCRSFGSVQTMACRH